MRLSLGVLVCLGIGAVCTAGADEPQATAPASTPAPAPTPAAAAAPVAAAAAPAVDSALDRHLLAEGYKAEMHNGNKVYCRREENFGSRLGAGKVCSSPEQIKATEDQSSAAVANAQKQHPVHQGQ